MCTIRHPHVALFRIQDSLWVTNPITGYLRVDTVHQGDQEGYKGVYHINLVDEVTQWEIICSVEKISEPHLVPALELALEAFPFVILGFHSDNGSEYVNKIVASLLQKLLIRFTKSRPRQSNDNALVECKNGAIVRKLLGYGRYRHAKQMKRAKKVEKKLTVRLGRVIRDIENKILGDESLQSIFSPSLKKARKIATQKMGDSDRLYSWHAPEVECIGKGKVHKPWEFGCKASVMTHANPSPDGNRTELF